MSAVPEHNRHESRCEQILDAAARAFCEHGFRGARIAEIAQRAGMSAGNLYHFYSGKDAILAALVDRELAHHTERIRQIADTPNPVNTLVVAILTEIQTPQDQSVLWLEMTAEAGRDPLLATRIRTWRRQFEDLVQPILATHRDQAPPLAEVRARMQLVGALIEGLRNQRISGTEFDWEHLLPQLNHLLAMLLRTGDPTEAGSQHPPERVLASGRQTDHG